MATAVQGAVVCPKCAGQMWDERKSKFFKPGKPIYRCKDKACDGVIFESQVAHVAAPSSVVIPPAGTGVPIQPPAQNGVAVGAQAKQYATLVEFLAVRFTALSEANDGLPKPTFADIQSAAATVWISAHRDASR